MTALQRRIKRGGAFLLMPLSLVPFFLIGPGIVESHRDFKREQLSRPLPAPEIVLSADELERWKPLPAFSGAVPVIAYEGIGGSGPRSVTHLQFARHLGMLSRVGYRTVSIDQYARWRRGEPADMPPKPIVIAFDGGRLSSFRAADRLLQRYGFRATMFVPTARIDAREDRALLSWSELHDMERSGRWDVQAEGTSGDARVVTGASGAMGPAYAFRRYTASEGVETYPDWQARVTRDVFAAREHLVAQGFDPVALSVPSGDYGLLGTNDARIPRQVRGLVGAQFGIGFVRHARNYPAYTTPDEPPARFEIGRTATADDLYRWLRAKGPAR